MWPGHCMDRMQKERGRGRERRDRMGKRKTEKERDTYKERLWRRDWETDVIKMRDRKKKREKRADSQFCLRLSQTPWPCPVQSSPDLFLGCRPAPSISKVKAMTVATNYVRKHIIYFTNWPHISQTIPKMHASVGGQTPCKTYGRVQTLSKFC